MHENKNFVSTLPTLPTYLSLPPYPHPSLIDVHLFIPPPPPTTLPLPVENLSKKCVDSRKHPLLLGAVHCTGV
jgi:hypothetical protein